MPHKQSHPEVVNLAAPGGCHVTVHTEGDRRLDIAVPADRRVSDDWVHSVTLTPSPGTSIENTFVSRWPTVGLPITVNGRAFGTVTALHVH